jgi:hypothetical protein
VILPQDLPQQLLYLSTAKQESLLIPEGGIDFDEEIVRIEAAYRQDERRDFPLCQQQAGKIVFVSRKSGSLRRHAATP